MGVPATRRSTAASPRTNTAFIVALRQRIRQPIVMTLGAVLLLSLSFLEQVQLDGWPQTQPIPVDIFRWLALLGLVLGAWLAFGLSFQIEMPSWAASRPARVWWPLAIPAGLMALCFAGVSAWHVNSNSSPSDIEVPWVLGMLCALAAAFNPHDIGGLRHCRAGRLFRRFVGWPTLALVGVLIAAAVLRLVSIEAVPRYWQADDFAAGLMAERVARGQDGLFSLGYGFVPMLTYAWPSVFLRLFEDSPAMLRGANAVLGVISVLAVAFLGAVLFNRRVGFAAAGISAASHVEVHYSRVGLIYTPVLAAACLTMGLLVQALRKSNRYAAVLCGIVLSIDLEIYHSARIVLLATPAICLILLLAMRSEARQRVAAMTWMLFGFAVGVAPGAVLILHNLRLFSSRIQDVSVFGVPYTSPGAAFAYGAYGTHSGWIIFWSQTWRVIQTFNFLGDADPHYGIARPLLDPVSGALFLAALTYACVKIRQPGFLVCLVMLFSTLLVGGVLTADPPSWERLIVMMPFVAVIIAALLDVLCRLVEHLPHGQSASWALLIATLSAIAYGNYHWYFDEYAPAIGQRIESSGSYDIATYLRASGSNTYAAVLTVPYGFIYNGEANAFIARNAPMCEVLMTKDQSFTHAFRKWECLPGSAGSVTFFVLPEVAARLPEIRRAFPHGVTRVFQAYWPFRDVDKIILYIAPNPAHRA